MTTISCVPAVSPSPGATSTGATSTGAAFPGAPSPGVLPSAGRRRSWRGWLVAAALAVATSLGLAAPAQAELRIDVTRGHIEPLPIAIVPFVGSTSEADQLGRDIVGVITDNLRTSGLFAPINQQAFIQTADSLQVRPRFSDWRAINAQALVHGAAAAQPDGRVRVEFRLWDVYGEQSLAGLAYFTQPDNWRRIAHIISDAIYKRLTGEDGYFDTRIVYVSESGPAQRRVRRLAIMDQDGANHQYLTDGSYMVLTPRFSPSRQEISFLSFQRGQPQVMIRNVDTDQQEPIGTFPGMTFAPRFSPDGQQLLFSMSRDGNTDIYVMDMRTRRSERLTNHPAIDTSPSFSPDASQIVFNSDRGGSQQLYVMNADGTDVQRISFGEGGRYATPVWSPRGDLIAFTKIQGGEFMIGVMRPDGSRERILSRSYQEEAPTWAPNGRVLMFFREGQTDRQGNKRSRLYAVDITGSNLREIPTPSEASDPAWSPLAP